MLPHFSMHIFYSYVRILAREIYILFGSLGNLASALKTHYFLEPRPTLCVRSEKLVFDSLVQWAEDKVSADDPESQSLALNLFQFLNLDHLKKCYVVDCLVRIGLDKNSVKIRKPDKKLCEECTFFTLHSRYEKGRI